MAKSAQARVTVGESLEVLGFQVGTALKMAWMKRGVKWLLSGTSGQSPFGPDHTKSYGIVRDMGTYKVFGLFERAMPRPQIGALYINSAKFSASPKEQWMIFVYGREYLPYFIECADMLAEKFSVKVHVELLSECQRPPYAPFYD